MGYSKVINLELCPIHFHIIKCDALGGSIGNARGLTFLDFFMRFLVAANSYSHFLDISYYKFNFYLNHCTIS